MLVVQEGCRVQLVSHGPKEEAPYDGFDLSFCDEVINANAISGAQLERSVGKFSPDCILMCSWNFTQYRKLCRKLRKKGVVVVAGMDNQWIGTMRQRIGMTISPWFLKPAIDYLSVAGDRQAQFARKLGYQDLIYGFYAANIDRFHGMKSLRSRGRNFICVARLIRAKGIRELIAGYRLYRANTEDPWRLRIVGIGPERSVCEGEPGIELRGFVQPADLRGELEDARCLVLPSYFEPWGVVIHEAAAAGLAVIASYHCGAATMFVRDGLNGAVISPTADRIAASMGEISRATEAELERMSVMSRRLASTLSPQILAGQFVRCLNKYREMKGRRFT